MGVSWTAEQQKVIDLRQRSILVSAAAGSGKTAVLVERIITMITEGAHPLDIDKLLIVTFTNAAAAEMRERISLAIEKKLETNLDNIHLQKQMTLIHNAQITTIHSFCLHVIRNYFNTIDLDPSFRIGDEGELKLLKSDVVSEIIEEFYKEKTEEFIYFIECYATGKSDKKIEKLILQIYNFSMSYPWPQVWLEECKKDYMIEETQGLEHLKWMQCLKETIKLYIDDLIKLIETAREIALSEGGPKLYVSALEVDLEQLIQIKACEDYNSYSKMFFNLQYARLSAKKDLSVIEQKKEQVKNLRDQMKKSLASLKEQYFYASYETIIKDMKQSRQQVDILMDLVIAFEQRYKAKKLEKNLLDFNDLEHLALEILVHHENEQSVPTEAAKDFAELFEEILIDEYQDSNMVQEMILNSISRISKGENNLFMVGDVKQSIYRFRLARPQLFMEKYESYSLTEAKCQRIDLHKNFRSRGQVLDGINFIFNQIMAKYLGNIEYGNDTALYVGATFKEGNNTQFSATELMLIDMETGVAETGEVEETERELEAISIAKRIHEIVGKELVLDKKTGEYRLASYRDIVILLRTISGWAEQFSSTLNHYGIPSYSISQTGYFSAIEVQSILNLLHIMDNPRQDIPIVAVLKSPICGFSGEELAIIKSKYKEEYFYIACQKYAKEGDNVELQRKLTVFYELLEDFRNKVPYTPMHELLWYILDKTGYGLYVSTQVGGKQRKANIDMLIEKAIAYEASSYKGLFNFIRYIENLKKYDIDFGEASVLSENEDTVRIMSIHKSKGLEFPIVFASGMGKVFNKQDSKSEVALHVDLGIGVDFIEPILRIKAPTILKRVIQKETALENLGEELRVLYVALTRAKEKLILTGSIKKLADKLKKWSYLTGEKEQKLPFYQLAAASSYWDWILPALIRHKSFTKVLEENDIEVNQVNPLYHMDIPYDVKIITLEQLVGEEIVKQTNNKFTREMLLNWDSSIVYDNKTRLCLSNQLKERYPFEQEQDIVTKVTVSELKRQGQHIDEEFSRQFFEEPEIIPYIPAFIQKDEKKNMAQRGTAYHKVLECIPFERISSKQKAEELITELVLSERILQETADLVNPYDIFVFSKSELANRMKMAKEQDKLFREQQFVLGIPASRVRKGWSEEELVLVQGIIDVFFYEQDNVILVDYKTDYIKEGEEQKLIDKYQIQLSYYEEAITRLTKKKVTEKIIYSFVLNKEIKIV
jgi:helicase-exonuclease AddAB, AddA subunit, Firmicutes type